MFSKLQNELLKPGNSNIATTTAVKSVLAKDGEHQIMPTTSIFQEMAVLDQLKKIKENKPIIKERSSNFTL